MRHACVRMEALARLIAAPRELDRTGASTARHGDGRGAEGGGHGRIASTGPQLGNERVAPRLRLEAGDSVQVLPNRRREHGMVVAVGRVVPGLPDRTRAGLDHVAPRRLVDGGRDGEGELVGSSPRECLQHVARADQARLGTIAVGAEVGREGGRGRGRPGRPLGQVEVQSEDVGGLCRAKRAVGLLVRRPVRACEVGELRGEARGVGGLADARRHVDEARHAEDVRPAHDLRLRDRLEREPVAIVAERDEAAHLGVTLTREEVDHPLGEAVELRDDRLVARLRHHLPRDRGAREPPARIARPAADAHVRHDVGHGAAGLGEAAVRAARREVRVVASELLGRGVAALEGVGLRRGGRLGRQGASHRRRVGHRLQPRRVHCDRVEVERALARRDLPVARPAALLALRAVGRVRVHVGRLRLHDGRLDLVEDRVALAKLDAARAWHGGAHEERREEGAAGHDARRQALHLHEPEAVVREARGEGLAADAARGVLVGLVGVVDARAVAPRLAD